MAESGGAEFGAERPSSMADKNSTLKCTFSAPGHSTTLLQGLASLRAQAQLLDVILTINNEVFQGHVHGRDERGQPGRDRAQRRVRQGPEAHHRLRLQRRGHPGPRLHPGRAGSRRLPADGAGGGAVRGVPQVGHERGDVPQHRPDGHHLQPGLPQGIRGRLHLQALPADLGGGGFPAPAPGAPGVLPAEQQAQELQRDRAVPRRRALAAVRPRAPRQRQPRALPHPLPAHEVLGAGGQRADPGHHGGGRAVPPVPAGGLQLPDPALPAARDAVPAHGHPLGRAVPRHFWRHPLHRQRPHRQLQGVLPARRGRAPVPRADRHGGGQQPLLRGRAGQLRVPGGRAAAAVPQRGGRRGRLLPLRPPPQPVAAHPGHAGEQDPVPAQRPARDGLRHGRPQPLGQPGLGGEVLPQGQRVDLRVLPEAQDVGPRRGHRGGQAVHLGGLRHLRGGQEGPALLRPRRRSVGVQDAHERAQGAARHGQRQRQDLRPGGPHGPRGSLLRRPGRGILRPRDGPVDHGEPHARGAVGGRLLPPGEEDLHRGGLQLAPEQRDQHRAGLQHGDGRVGEGLALPGVFCWHRLRPRHPPAGDEPEVTPGALGEREGQSSSRLSLLLLGRPGKPLPSAALVSQAD
uniref:kelch-like protein 26 isoform X1 n=1 Tax=Agelaius phoeniceus TaxID=39638 RepID=UPI0023ED8B01|nr:kelch-like protein 26 isoform X1 [Agelaius phoeniceus]